MDRFAAQLTNLKQVHEVETTSMRTHIRRFARLQPMKRLVAVLAVVLGLSSVAPMAEAAGKQPHVLPPNARPHGLSYGEWNAKWWQWVLSVPAASNPLLDDAGINCAAGQSGNVWFLAGTYTGTNPVVRTKCTVPTGTMFFIPLVNYATDNLTCTEPDTTYTVEELRALAGAPIDAAKMLVAEIDGKRVANIERYRAKSPVFGYTLPDENVLQALGCTDAPSGTYSPAVADGYYVMIAPLSPGKHTVRVAATIGEPYNFSNDITYHLTVVPRGQLGR